jgi:peptidoglycan/LPS O-acetylase OafA/YrhL
MLKSEEGSTHLPALDGLRGLAILMVLLHHLSEPFLFISNPWRKLPVFTFGGWTGVDLFFVLSGFLITGILWESRSSANYFRNFYARRTLRLFPLYYGVLILIFFVLPLLAPIAIAGSARAGQWAGSIEELRGIFLVALRGPLFASHFWSLAVEEHFYLAWPLLIRRLRHSALIKLTIALMIAPFFIRLCLLHFASPVGIYVLTPCRMDGLAMGSFVALFMRKPSGLQALRSWIRVAFPAIFFLWFALYLYQRGAWLQYGVLQQTIGYSLTAALFACLLIQTLTEKRWAALFSHGSLRFFGKFSYGIYVIHVLAFHYIEQLFSLGRPGHFSIVGNILLAGTESRGQWPRTVVTLDGICFVALAVTSSVLGAMVSWYLIELPFLNLKRFFPYEKRHPSSGADLVLSLAENAGAVSPQKEPIN